MRVNGDVFVADLAAACVGDSMSRAERSEVVRVLSSSLDPRSEPCLVHVLDAHSSGDDPADVQRALRGVSSLGLRGAAPAVWRLLMRFEAGRRDAAELRHDVGRAVLALADAGQEPPLLDVLERPPSVDPTPLVPDAGGSFRQRTAAAALGKLRSERAVVPLYRAALSPRNAAGDAAVRALVAIGRPAVSVGVALVEGKQPELAQWSTQEHLRAAQNPNPMDAGTSAADAHRAHLLVALIVLGAIGRGEAVPPLLALLAASRDAGQRGDRGEARAPPPLRACGFRRSRGAAACPAHGAPSARPGGVARNARRRSVQPHCRAGLGEQSSGMAIDRPRLPRELPMRAICRHHRCR